MGARAIRNVEDKSLGLLKPGGPAIPLKSAKPVQEVLFPIAVALQHGGLDENDQFLLQRRSGPIAIRQARTRGVLDSRIDWQSAFQTDLHQTAQGHDIPVLNPEYRIRLVDRGFRDGQVLLAKPNAEIEWQRSIIHSAHQGMNVQ